HLRVAARGRLLQIGQRGQAGGGQLVGRLLPYVEVEVAELFDPAFHLLRRGWLWLGTGRLGRVCALAGQDRGGKNEAQQGWGNARGHGSFSSMTGSPAPRFAGGPDVPVRGM